MSLQVRPLSIVRATLTRKQLDIAILMRTSMHELLRHDGRRSGASGFLWCCSRMNLSSEEPRWQRFENCRAAVPVLLLLGAKAPAGFAFTVSRKVHFSS